MQAVVLQVQGVLHLPKSEKNVAGVGHLKRIFKVACRVAGVVKETCSSEMLGEFRRPGR